MQARSLMLIAMLLLCLPGKAWAWGPAGHRIVGQLAEARLHPAALAQVRRLLADEQDASLAGVSNWADDLRATGSPLGRATSRWHFVNFQGGDCGYVPARDCPDGNCVVAAISRNFLVLADRSRPDAEREVALKFLVHLVADVHQPLHATARDDRGGGLYQVSYHGLGRNLHWVWDSLILEQRNLSDADYVRMLGQQPALAPDPTRRSDRPAVDWAVESCALVDAAQLYPRGHLIDEAYVTAHRALVDQRLRQAGSRLADMLNFALDPRRTTLR